MPPLKQVAVSRLELDNPKSDNLEHKTIQIEYHAGELPPRFIYISKDKWNAELERKMIKEDIEKRMSKPLDMITL